VLFIFSTPEPNVIKDFFPVNTGVFQLPTHGKLIKYKDLTGTIPSRKGGRDRKQKQKSFEKCKNQGWARWKNRCKKLIRYDLISIRYDLIQSWRISKNTD
jgi:hypothetical protein